jgi:hypothetical protein
MMMKNESYAINIAALLELEIEEISYILTDRVEVEGNWELKPPAEDIVQKIYSEAQSLLEKDRIHDIDIFGGFGEYRKKKDDNGMDGEMDGMMKEGEYPEGYVEDYGEEKDENKGLGKDKIGEEKVVEKNEKRFDKEVKKTDKSQRTLFDF